MIRRQGPWRNLDTVEIATAESIGWYNNQRLNQYCGDMPPPSWNKSTALNNNLQPQGKGAKPTPDMPGRFSDALANSEALAGTTICAALRHVSSISRLLTPTPKDRP